MLKPHTIFWDILAPHTFYSCLLRITCDKATFIMILFGNGWQIIRGAEFLEAHCKYYVCTILLYKPSHDS